MEDISHVFVIKIMYMICLYINMYSLEDVMVMLHKIMFMYMYLIILCGSISFPSQGGIFMQLYTTEVPVHGTWGRKKYTECFTCWFMLLRESQMPGYVWQRCKTSVSPSSPRFLVPNRNLHLGIESEQRLIQQNLRFSHGGCAPLSPNQAIGILALIQDFYFFSRRTFMSSGKGTLTPRTSPGSPLPASSPTTRSCTPTSCPRKGPFAATCPVLLSTRQGVDTATTWCMMIYKYMYI